MWATYKSEIMEREMDEKDFLKNFYERNRAQHQQTETEEETDANAGGEQVVPSPDGRREQHGPPLCSRCQLEY